MTWSDIDHFVPAEFDSPDVPGSGKECMVLEFVAQLDQARKHSGCPYRVTSGYRTPEHHDYLTEQGYKTSKNSSHLLGYAADISTPDSATRYKVVRGLIKAGITRIGIGKTFVHCDSDPNKTQGFIWLYR